MKQKMVRTLFCVFAVVSGILLSGCSKKSGDAEPTKDQAAAAKSSTKARETKENIESRSQLGETIQQCDSRYGTPIESKPDNRKYKYEGIEIGVHFKNNKAVLLSYTASLSIFGLEKAAILVSQSCNNAAWSRPVKNVIGGTMWYRSDGGFASYMEPAGEGWLTIHAPDFYIGSKAENSISENIAQYKKYASGGNVGGL